MTCELNRLIRGLFPESRFSFQSRCGGPLQSQFPATRVAFTQHRSISRAFSKRGHEVISAIGVVLRIIEFSRDVTKLQCLGESIDRQTPKCDSGKAAAPLPAQLAIIHAALGRERLIDTANAIFGLGQQTAHRTTG